MFHKKTLLASIALLALLSSPVFADPPATTSSTNLSGSIAVTNTFQSIQAQKNNRLGCTVQNLGANAMYVYFGSIAGAATTASAKLNAGQSVNCTLAGINYVLRDQVSITGTSGDAFFANFQ